MDINLPLILFIAVAGSGAVWLFDLLVLRTPRLRAIERVEGEFQQLSEGQRETDQAYQSAIAAVKKEPSIVEYSKSFFPVLLLVFVLRSFLIEPFQIPSESMVPTLEVGDFIAVSKFSYGIRLPIIRRKIIPISDPKRGDVMVFFPPHETRYFIKRVVGIPGDTIRYKNNILYVNGEEVKRSNAKREPLRRTDQCIHQGGHYVLTEEHLGEKTHTKRECSLFAQFNAKDEWKVPEGHYFMMGDNRNNSSDSRSWGTVHEDRIVGKAFAIWMHWNEFFSIPSFSRVGTL
ncbi:MAG: signal peptidase I [Cellvibrionaceae bacterium]|nr:signal peptidase I [Cellvibrionaceae bacterium]